jgi:hypothetical protein
VPSLHGSSGLTRNYLAKPAYYAAAHLQSTLGQYRFTKVVQETAGSLYVYCYTRGTDPNDLIWAIWSPTGSDRTAAVTLSNLPGTPVWAEQMPLGGGAAPAVSFTQPGSGQVSLTIGESPTYLHIQVVPEPGAVGMLTIGGAAFLLRRSRRHSWNCWTGRSGGITGECHSHTTFCQ